MTESVPSIDLDLSPMKDRGRLGVVASEVTAGEYALLAVGVFAAVVHGSSHAGFFELYRRILEPMSTRLPFLMGEVDDLCLYLFLLGCGVAVFAAIQHGIFRYVTSRVVARTKVKLFRLLLEQPDSTHSPAELASRFLSLSEQLDAGFSTVLSSAVTDACRVVSGLIWVLIQSWEMFLKFFMGVVTPLVVVGVAAGVGLAISVVPTLRRCAAVQRGIEVVANWRIVHFFRTGGIEIERMRLSLQSSCKAARNSLLLRAAGRGFAIAAGYSYTSTGIWIGAEVLKANRASGATLVAIIACCFVSLTSVMTACFRLATLVEANGAILRITALSTADDGENGGLHEVVRSFVPPAEVLSSTGELSIDKVSFSYHPPAADVDPDMPVYIQKRRPHRRNSSHSIPASDVPATELPVILQLTDISLSLRRGESVVIHGVRGCGKTTLANILLRHLEPLAGTYAISNVDMQSHCTDAQFYQLVGGSRGDDGCYRGTVADNLGAAPEDPAVVDICRALELDSYIQALPQGYNTVVCQSGEPLSPAVASRVALARTLLRDPYVLVIDNPTYGQDPASCAAVVRALQARISRPDRITILFSDNASLGTAATAVKELKEQDSPVVDRSRGYRERLVTLQESAASKLSNAENTGPAHPWHGASMAISDAGCTPVTTLGALSGLWSYMRQSCGLIVVGALGMALYGGVLPVYGYVEGLTLRLFTDPTRDGINKDTHIFGVVIQLSAGGVAFGWMLSSLLQLAGERGLNGLSLDAYRAMLHDPTRADTAGFVSALCTGPHPARALPHAIIGGICSSIAALAVGFTLAAFYSWKLTCVGLALAPVVALNGFMDDTVIARHSRRLDTTTQRRVYEAFGMSRRLKELGLLDDHVRSYKAAVSSTGGGLGAGLLYGLGRLGWIGGYALLFWYGKTLFEEGVTHVDIVLVAGCTFRSAVLLGEVAALLHSVGSVQDIGWLLHAAKDTKLQADAGHPLEYLAQHISSSNAVQGAMERQPAVCSYQLRALQYGPTQQGPTKTFALPPQKVTALLFPTPDSSTAMLDVLAGQQPFNGSVVRELGNNKQVECTPATVRDGSWGGDMSLVPAPPLLFSASVRWNVCYSACLYPDEIDKPSADHYCLWKEGRLAAGMSLDVYKEQTEALEHYRSNQADAVKGALRRAGVEEEITQIEGGVDAMLWGKGDNLSYELRVAVAVARALYVPTSTVLVDGRSIDFKPDAATLVVNALQTAAHEEHRCVVVCTTDKAVARKCDHVVVFQDDGAVCRDGPPASALRDG